MELSLPSHLKSCAALYSLSWEVRHQARVMMLHLEISPECFFSFFHLLPRRSTV